MANNIRGGGLFGPTPAPAALFENPERLDREGGQSSEPPPPYRSRLSHNPDLFRRDNLFQSPGLFQNPDQPSEEQILREEQSLREERKCELIKDHGASLPLNQFGDEKIEEMKRIEEARRNQTNSAPIGRSFDHLAWENVKTRWVEQVIWNEKWRNISEMVRWKHEEPLELESGSEDDLAAEGEPRRLVREREREASRPFHQFVYQVSKERERIQDELNSPIPPLFDPLRTIRGTTDYYLHLWAPHMWTQDEPNEGRATDETPRDINTAAYVRVKNTWTERGIWDERWRVLPGMSWKHEQPLEEMLHEELGDNVGTIWALPPGGYRYEREQAPPRTIFRADLFPGPYNQAPSIRNAPQQEEPPKDTISGVLESHGYGAGGAPSGPVTGTYSNSSPQDPTPATGPEELLSSDISHASTASNLWYSARMDPPQRVLSQREQYEHYSAITEAGLAAQSLGQRSGDGQTVPIAHTATGPVHSTKVSKSHRKSGRGPRRQQNASEARSETRNSSPGLGVPALPTTAAPASLRRSSRLQEVAHNGGSQSRPGQASAGPRLSR